MRWSNPSFALCFPPPLCIHHGLLSTDTFAFSLTVSAIVGRVCGLQLNFVFVCVSALLTRISDQQFFHTDN